MSVALDEGFEPGGGDVMARRPEDGHGAPFEPGYSVGLDGAVFVGREDDAEAFFGVWAPERHNAAPAPIRTRA